MKIFLVSDRVNIAFVAASQEDATKQKNCDIDQLLKYKKMYTEKKLFFR